MTTLRAPFLLVLLLMAPLLATAQTFSTPLKLSGSTAAHSPMAQFGRNGDLYVAWYANAADIYIARSADEGQTFTNPIRVSRQVTSNIYTSLLQRTPRFIVDTKGVIHMVWTEERQNGQSDVWYVRSTDRGDSWTSPVSIMDPDDSVTYPQDFCNIACDSSDNLYVAYLDFRGVVRGREDYAQLHLTKSTNGGGTWSLPVVANKFRNGIGGTCECCKLDIAVTAAGIVNIAFRSNIDNKRDVWLARSRDGGTTFDSTIRVQTGTWTIGGCPTTGPSIALDSRDHLYLAWRDSRDDSGKAICYFASCGPQDPGSPANLQVSRPGLQSANWPTIAVNGDAVAYGYQAGASPRARFRYSTDRGATWSQDLPFPNASNVEQSLPSLAFSATGELVAVWQEGGNSGSIVRSVVSGLPVANSPIVCSIDDDTIEYLGALHLHWNPSGSSDESYNVQVYDSTATSLVWEKTVTGDTQLTIAPAPFQPGVWKVVITSDPGNHKSVATSFIVLPAADVRSDSPAEPIEPLDRISWQQGEISRVEIFDMRGSLVFSDNAGVGYVQLDRLGLSAGVYVLRLHGKSGSEDRRVIIR